MLVVIVLGLVALILALSCTGLNDPVIRNYLWSRVPVLPKLVRTIQGWIERRGANTPEESSDNADSELETVSAASESAPSEPENVADVDVPEPEPEEEPEMPEPTNDVERVITATLPDVTRELVASAIEGSTQARLTLLKEQGRRAADTATRPTDAAVHDNEVTVEGTPTEPNNGPPTPPRPRPSTEEQTARLTQHIASVADLAEGPAVDATRAFVTAWLDPMERTEAEAALTTIASLTAVPPHVMLALGAGGLLAAPPRTSSKIMDSLFQSMPARVKQGDTPFVKALQEELDTLDDALRVYEYLTAFRFTIPLQKLHAFTQSGVPEQDMRSMVTDMANSGKPAKEVIRVTTSAADRKKGFLCTPLARVHATLLEVYLEQHDIGGAAATARHLTGMKARDLTFMLRPREGLPDVVAHTASTPSAHVSLFIVRLLLAGPQGTVKKFDPLAGILGAAAETAPSPLLVEGRPPPDSVGPLLTNIIADGLRGARDSATVALALDTDPPVTISDVSMAHMAAALPGGLALPALSPAGLASLRTISDWLLALNGLLQLGMAPRLESVCNGICTLFLPTSSDLAPLYRLALHALLALVYWEHDQSHVNVRRVAELDSQALDSVMLLFDPKYGLHRNRVLCRIASTVDTLGDTLSPAALMAILTCLFGSDIAVFCPELYIRASGRLVGTLAPM